MQTGIPYGFWTQPADEKKRPRPMTCALIMLVERSIHDGDHIRQAYLESDTRYLGIIHHSQKRRRHWAFRYSRPTLLVLESHRVHSPRGIHILSGPAASAP